jgi:hypothetical protein
MELWLKHIPLGPSDHPKTSKIIDRYGFKYNFCIYSTKDNKQKNYSEKCTEFLFHTGKINI